MNKEGLKRILKDIIVNEKKTPLFENVLDLLEKYDIAYTKEYCWILNEIAEELQEEGYRIFWSVDDDDDCYYWIE